MTDADRPTILLRPAIPYSQEYGAEAVVHWDEPATRYHLVMVGGGPDDRRLDLALAIIAERCLGNEPAATESQDDGRDVCEDRDRDPLEDAPPPSPHTQTDELCLAAVRPMDYPFSVGVPRAFPFEPHSALALDDALAMQRIASRWVAERYEEWAAARGEVRIGWWRRLIRRMVSWSNA